MPDLKSIDHKDGNPINNKKSNLRPSNHQQNIANRKINKNNRSGFKGVSWHKYREKWVAQIKVNGKQINLGGFDSKIDAAIAYDEAAKKYFGEFANTNF